MGLCWGNSVRRSVAKAGSGQVGGRGASAGGVSGGCVRAGGVGSMRRIDGKFTIQNDQIIHPSGDIVPEEEPLFLLRARDHLALYALLKYEELSLLDNCTSYHMEGIENAIAKFRQFKKAY